MAKYPVTVYFLMIKCLTSMHSHVQKIENRYRMHSGKVSFSPDDLDYGLNDVLIHLIIKKIELLQNRVFLERKDISSAF